MEYDLANCLVLNTRMAARAVTRRYEHQLRRHGITAAQFSLLASISADPERSITEIAERLAMDRTTASRNLDLLARKMLIEVSDDTGGNRRSVSLSDKGRHFVDIALPAWRAAQDELREILGTDGFDQTIAMLQKLAKL